MLFVALLAVFAEQADADVVVMKNGDRLSGKVQQLRNGKVTITTDYASSIVIAIDQIASLVTDEDVTVTFKDYSRLIGPLRVSDGVAAVQNPADGTTVPLDPTRVSALQPGRQAEDDWNVSGRANLGLTDTSGNTEVRRYNVDGEVIARRLRDRWTASARANEAAERGQETEMNAVVGLKYDRFIDERWYGYGGSTFEHDRFKDLRLRATVGAGAGRQIYESSVTNLALEAGLDRVLADHFDAEDERYFALRLASRFDHWLWEDVIQVFNNDQVYVSLADIQSTFVRTQSGLRFPLRHGLVTTLQLNVDWDGNPGPGREGVDRQLLVSLGYKW
ncbi:MAG: DUF481 domain-containing protein [Betaproteobacteria bacterium]